MGIGNVASSGSIQSLEMMMRFGAQRQQVLAHNIANLSTPNFVQQDVSVKNFQKALADAVSTKWKGSNPGNGKGLAWEDTSEVSMTRSGQMLVNPSTPSGNVLFHDRNNRDVEHLMQDLTENVGMFRLASDLLRSRFDLLRAAYTERP